MRRKGTICPQMDDIGRYQRIIGCGFSRQFDMGIGNHSVANHRECVVE